VRRIPALVTAAALVAGLAACTPAGAATGGCTVPFAPGAASSTVRATGDVGTTPDIDIPTPLISDGAQLSVLEPGEGDAYPAGSWLSLEYTAVSGTDGTLIGQTSYGSDAPLLLSTRSGGVVAPEDSTLLQALVCVKQGERLALTTTVKASLGEGGLGGGHDDDTIVWVIDVLNGYFGQAVGGPSIVPDGFPAVVTAPDGTPAISLLPNQQEPSELRVTNTKSGAGPVVEKGDQVVVNYTVWVWPADGGELSSPAETSWGKQPATFTLDEDHMIPGVVSALVGKRVGSQVVAIIPPELAYKDKANGAIPANSTLVFVIDILGQPD